MTMVERTISIYASTPALKTEMEKVYPSLGQLLSGLKVMAGEATRLMATCDFAGGFKIWQVFVNHVESRETKDGGDAWGPR